MINLHWVPAGSSKRGKPSKLDVAILRVSEGIQQCCMSDIFSEASPFCCIKTEPGRNPVLPWDGI